MKAFIVAVMVLFCTVAYAQALPTLIQNVLTFEDPDNEPGVVTGYYLYYADAEGKVYTNENRVSLGMPIGLVAPLAMYAPNLAGRLCFKLTAHDVNNDESSFSNEACAYVGGLHPPVIINIIADTVNINTR